VSVQLGTLVSFADVREAVSRFERKLFKNLHYRIPVYL
jgi:hypothetical protein